MKKIIDSYIASGDSYEKLGLKKEPALWEDGFRTGGAEGTYEWWYFDAHFGDGTKVVIVFYTKRMMTPGAPLSPYVTIDLDTADGLHLEERVETRDITFSAAKDGCLVRLGDSYIIREESGLLRVRYSDKTITVDAVLKPSLPFWRPETGHIFFGERDYFAWLPSVPAGAADVTISLNGKVSEHKGGTGYHDHNWGNKPMNKLMNHWYWGRAEVGRYNVISSYITGEKAYGYNEYPIFMLAKDGKILADDGNKLKFTAAEEFIEEVTGKPVHGKLIYDYTDGNTRYTVTYKREKSLINFKMIEQLKGIVKLGAKLIGFSGAYHRFSGSVSVERYENGVKTDEASASAVWELMYFGKTPKSENKE
ncbi:MAG: hypothetical protein LBP62_04385 [Clostridiales bacterium]|jgi:hypothetical protein|nr:hypothetical protein [Clostridiales bacterium]